MGVTCVVEDCEKSVFRCDWCSMHYYRLLRYGDLDAVHKPGKPRSLGECSVEGCRCPAIARDFCTKHYQRWSKFGDPLTVKLDRDLSPQERFWTKVNKDGPLADPDGGPCWIWTAALVGGFGVFSYWNHQYKAHLVSYAWSKGLVPHRGLETSAKGTVTHRCLVRSCVRPDHLVLTPGFVYVARNGSFCKIGYSENPKRRIRELQCANPLPVELVGITPGSREAEAKWHAKFRDRHVRNEWFELTDEDVRDILGESIRQEARTI